VVDRSQVRSRHQDLGLDFDSGVVKALASGARSSAGSRSRGGWRRRGWSEYSGSEAKVRERKRIRDC